MAKAKRKAKVVPVDTEYKGLGALPNPIDTRDISLARVQAPVKLPKKYKTDISKLLRRDQKRTGSCVGQAGAGAVDFFNLIEQGKLANASARGIYALCKHRDGLEESGTYPRILAQVLTTIGAPTTELVKDDFTLSEKELVNVPETKELLQNAYPFRVDTNYAWVDDNDVEALKQAIYQNKVVLMSMRVGRDYSDGRMTSVNPRGRHYVLFFGFETLSNGDTRLDFLNSWDKNWGKDGCGYVLWSEMSNSLYDALAFVDIPNAILEEAKQTYKFLTDLEPGSRGYDVTQLQKRLAQEIAADGQPCFRYTVNGAISFTAYYGSETEKAVQRYQIVKGIVSSGTPKTTGFGRLGTRTRDALNGSVPVKIGSYPIVAAKRDQLVAIMAAVGFPIVVTDEYRTVEEQNALYAKGRTLPGEIVTNAKGGESLHNFRCAFDVAFKKGTGVTYDGDFAMLGRVGKILGLEWGGDWASFVDKPHFQFTAGYDLADFQQGRIDESKFGVVSKDAENLEGNTNPSMSFTHRLKSFAISFLSIAASALGAALLVALGSPEFAAVLFDLGTWLGALGVPASLVTLIGLVITEVVKHILNKRKIAKAEREGVTTSFDASRVKRIELY